MKDPVPVDGPPREPIRTLRSVSPARADGEADVADLAAELAKALRAVRGFVPHRVWWDEGPAQALLAYQARQEE